MTDDRSRHLQLRALADYLGKEFYAVDYDASSGCFRLLAPPNTGLEPLAYYRVRTDADPSDAGLPHEMWHYLGADYHIYGPVPAPARA